MITYKQGDVTKADEKGLKALCHIVNSRNSFASGVVVSIAKKWPHVKRMYHDWYQSTVYNDEINDETVPFELGEIQIIKADDETYVINMLAQKLGGDNLCGEYLPPIRLEAVKECIMRVADFIKKSTDPITLTVPKFGSLRAGGNFDRDILPLIEKYWGELDVVIYEYQE